jgi:hypothetical protein
MTEAKQNLPTLHPDELAELQRIAGRSLTNDEAQLLLRKITIEAAFNAWLLEEKCGKINRESL